MLQIKNARLVALAIALSVAISACAETPIDVAPPAAHATSASVAGAVRASSPNFTLYGTLQSGDGSSASRNHQRRGGIVGTVQGAEGER